jgi:MSHA biogenesis protein MshP
MTRSPFTRLGAHRKSAGVALVTAIFLLVVLAGLAVAVVSLTTTQQAASVQDVQGQRAYQAAKAGNEWALYIALRTATQPTPAATLGCPGTFTGTMPAGTLSGFTVTVRCGAVVDGHFTIESTACNQPSAGVCPNATRGAEYVQRVLTVQL